MSKGSPARTGIPAQEAPCLDVARLRAGDPHAFAAWVRSIAPALRGFLAASGIKDLDDVLQEIWIRLVRALPRFEGDLDGLRRLTFTIAYRARADAYRERSRRRESPTDPADLPEAATAAPSPDTGEVARLLATLPETQALVISLRLFGGLNSFEVGELLNLPDGTVRSLQQRGLRRLAHHLANETTPTTRPGDAPLETRR